MKYGFKKSNIRKAVVRNLYRPTVEVQDEL